MGKPIPMSSDIVASSAVAPPSVYAKPVTSSRRVAAHEKAPPTAMSNRLASMMAKITSHLTKVIWSWQIEVNKRAGRPMVET